jgi:hypothetical protein
LASAIAAWASGGRGHALGRFRDQPLGGRIGQGAQRLGRQQGGRQAQGDRAFLLGGVGHRALEDGGGAHRGQQQQGGGERRGGELAQAARADRLGGGDHQAGVGAAQDDGCAAPKVRNRTMNRPQGMHPRVELVDGIIRIGGNMAGWRHGMAFHSSDHAAPRLWLGHGVPDGARDGLGPLPCDTHRTFVQMREVSITDARTCMG